MSQTLKYTLIWLPKVITYKPLVISGCSGAGKSCLINFLRQKHEQLFQLNPSYTTRKPRPGEIPGVDYIFCTPHYFTKLQKSKAFIYSFIVHGNMYGTHLGKVTEIVSKGKVCLLDLDVQGGEYIHHRFPEWNYVFIKCPSFEDLRARLQSRNTESQEVIEQRLKNARKEIEKLYTLKFYDIIVNQNLEEAKSELLKYVSKKYELEI